MKSGRFPNVGSKSRESVKAMSLALVCRGVEWGVEGKQVGSMDEESQVRGCYNITFICTPTTRKQCLYWKRHKQTKHLEHESKYKV